MGQRRPTPAPAYTRPPQTLALYSPGPMDARRGPPVFCVLLILAVLFVASPFNRGSEQEEGGWVSQSFSQSEHSQRHPPTYPTSAVPYALSVKGALGGRKRAKNILLVRPPPPPSLSLTEHNT